jgi:Inhibitor of Apoptosis domain
MAAAVVDVLFSYQDNYFYSGDKETVKELAVVDVKSLASQQWRFTDPCIEKALQEFNCCLFPRHGILDGDVPYENLTSILRKATESYKVLYVYGRNEYNCIKKLLERTSIFNLQDFADIKFEQLPLIPGTECLHHFQRGNTYICPHANAYRLAEWCNENWDSVNMMEAEGRLKTFKNWTLNTVSKDKLAAAGFTHRPTENFKDLTECIYCGLQVFNWSQEEDPCIKHRMLNKYCVLFNFCTIGNFDV